MSPRAEPAQAVREVNIAYSEAPEPKPDHIFHALATTEAEIDRAFSEGDEAGAREIVACWREEALRILSTHLLNAPLDPMEVSR